MRFEIESKIVLRILHKDGTTGDICGVARTESFEGNPKDFKGHVQIVGYEIDRQVEKEFDKVFPSQAPLPVTASPSAPTILDDEIPF